MSRLAAAGIELPVSPEPLANYVPATRNGRLVYTSGQLPLRAGQLLHRGKLGREVTLKQGRECDRPLSTHSPRSLPCLAALAVSLRL
ncbi:RidA family protein [Polymorphospora sp. NPDC050346]|uniref:RidA family protein n=1 Tax=Polymorphospora sp. NPDC050346 TaxID=3155780 RepID=UPI0033C3516C